MKNREGDEGFEVSNGLFWKWRGRGEEFGKGTTCCSRRQKKVARKV